MGIGWLRYVAPTLVVGTLLACTTPDQMGSPPLSASIDPAQAGSDKVEDAISLIKTLDRPGKINLATIRDGNKYIQCRQMNDEPLRCEAGGSLMQASLEKVLTPERVGRLASMGWMIDASFGNYVKTFPRDAAARDVADDILAALTQGYDFDIEGMGITTRSVRMENCPPRVGPSQDLAGSINASSRMATTAIHACVYHPKDNRPKHVLGPDSTVADLVNLYGAQVTTEIHRLRVNLNHDVYAIFDVGIGYVQCAAQTRPDGFYCEAQSAYGWAPMAAVLTPERIARLHAAGFADPGRGLNYSRVYLAKRIDDGALAAEILTLLHDVYGYYGASKLTIKTEED